MEPSDLVAVVPPWANQPSNHPRRSPLRRNPPRQARNRTPAPTRRIRKKNRNSSKSSPRAATMSNRRRPRLSNPIRNYRLRRPSRSRKDYLLTRFWISARGYWGKNGDRLAWLFTIGLLLLIVANVGFQYGINVWNRAIFDAIEKRNSATVYYLAAVFFPLAIGSVLLGVAQVFARMGIQRRWRAWLTNCGDIALAGQRPLLSAQPRRRRSQEPGISHRRRSADRDRLAGGFRRRRDIGIPLGRDLHRRALDHRRRADGHARAARPSPSRAFS